MKLLTTTDLYNLELAVEAKLEGELDELMKIGSLEERQLQVEHGLLGRLLKASAWLSMMQKCVKTDEAVIALDESVSVALFDAYIAVPK